MTSRNEITPDQCKFCKSINNKEKTIFENKHIVVMFGRQHHKGHLLVMPRIHEEHILSLKEKTLSSFFMDTVKIIKALNKAIKSDRINLEYLDNWDPHIHWNIYPRFKEDKDWGNPPVIPIKGKKFTEQHLTDKEMKIFLRELDKIKSEL